MAHPSFAQAESRPINSAPVRDTQSLARRLLLDAIVLGGLADALLRGGFGVGLLVWVLVLVGTFALLVRRRGDHVSGEQQAWLATGLFFAAAFAFRDSESLLFYDFLAILFVGAMLGSISSKASPMRTVLGQRVRDLAQAWLRAMQTGVIAIVYAIRASAVGARAHGWSAGPGKTVLRGALLALPLLLVFGALLSSADPVFGSLFSLPNVDLGEVISHLVIAGVVAWIIGGWLYGALIDERGVGRVGDGMPITLGRTDITIVLGCLVALFALFVGVQVRWLFGGEQLVRSTTGLSYAQYARRGFFELVMVSLLVLPVLLGSRAAIPKDDAAAIRRHRALSIPLLLLLAGVMASALGRMALYVHYYGLSTDRLNASVFMLWLAVVFAWFGLTVLRGRTHDFAAGMTITGFATLAALNLMNPEALVARVNIARAHTALVTADSVTATAAADAPVDLAYLTYRLSGDAASEVVDAVLAGPVSPVGAPSRTAEVKARCDAVRGLFRRWGTGTIDQNAWRHSDDWRLWNLGASRASEAVRTHDPQLRAVTCWDASGEVPFGDRDGRPARPREQWYDPTKPESH